MYDIGAGEASALSEPGEAHPPAEARAAGSQFPVRAARTDGSFGDCDGERYVSQHREYRSSMA